MRKYNYSLIKKTEALYGLAKGEAKIDYPIGSGNENLMFANLYGNTVYYEEDYRSVGDADGNGKYRLSFERSGRNLMNGKTYATLHKAKATGYAILNDTLYYIIPSIQDNGKTIISRDEIAFKPNTVYSLAACMRYNSPNRSFSPMQAQNIYTDGSNEPIRFQDDAAEVYGVFSSAEGKSIQRIEHFNDASVPTKIVLASFGIFEGKFESYDEAFEPYGVFEGALILNEPLRSLGYVSDVLDLSALTVKRKIYEMVIDGDSCIETTDTEGVFKVYTTVTVKEDSPIVSEVRKMSLEDLKTNRKGAAIAEGGDAVYIKLDGIKSLVDFIPRVTEDDVRLFMIRENYIDEAVSGDSPLNENSGASITVTTVIPPKKQIMIYKRKDLNGTDIQT
jgi:hypothetical protein